MTYKNDTIVLDIRTNYDILQSEQLIRNTEMKNFDVDAMVGYVCIMAAVVVIVFGLYQEFI